MGTNLSTRMVAMRDQNTLEYLRSYAWGKFRRCISLTKFVGRRIANKQMLPVLFYSADHRGQMFTICSHLGLKSQSRCTRAPFISTSPAIHFSIANYHFINNKFLSSNLYSPYIFLTFFYFSKISTIQNLN